MTMFFSSSWRLTLPPPLFSTKLVINHGKLDSLQVHASSIEQHQETTTTNSSSSNSNKKKKVLVVGSGWSGLGAAHHLSKQGFDVTVLEDGDDFGSSDDIGIQGFWYPHQNIFSLVDDLAIKPFTNWMKSAQYSQDGLEAEFPIYQDLPQLPSPLGSLLYTQFPRVPLLERLASLPVMAAVIDFDNTDTSWRKYDPITARELLRQYGCSQGLYRDVLRPLLQVGLYAPPEQCSAAATLAMLYYLVLAHQGSKCTRGAKEMFFQTDTSLQQQEIYPGLFLYCYSLDFPLFFQSLNFCFLHACRKILMWCGVVE